MAANIGEELDEYETAAFLREQGLGVVSLATAGEAYAVPMAFAYDEDRNRCLLRFVMGEESRKRSVLAGTGTATLVTFEWHGADDWRSAVARGPIEELPNEDLAEAAALFSELGAEAALDVFNGPISDYETGWYALEIEEVTGRGAFE